MRPARLALALALSLLGVFGSAQAATAPGGQNLTASPTQIQPQLDAGASTTGTITIVNDGIKPYDFKSYVTAYRVAGEDYDPSFPPGSGRASDPVSWVHLPAQIFHSHPGQTTAVPYTIIVPAGTGGGGYYAVLFFETIPQTAAGSGVASTQRVGIVAYIRVNGSVALRGSVAGFTVRPLQPGPPLTSELRLKNDGNVHYLADVTEHVADPFGRPKATIHVQREVLPGTTRRFILAWDAAPAFGLFQVSATVNLLILGRQANVISKTQREF